MEASQGIASRSDLLNEHSLRVRREERAYRYLEKFRDSVPDGKLVARIETIRGRRELVERRIEMLSSQRQQKFKATLRRRPVVGDTLRTINGAGVRVRIETKPDRGSGESQIYFVYAVVDDSGSGWYLSDEPHGVVCLLRPSAVSVSMKNGGVLRRVRVISWNARNTAMICGSCEKD